MSDQALLRAPYPYFGGKRSIAAAIWARLGSPRQYIEPFCGSAAVLLAKPGGPASLEVAGDYNGFIANFWRAVKHQPRAWLSRLSDRLARVRLIHGDWSRCLNHHYGGVNTAIFFDPPYKKYESVYGCAGVADAVAAWAADNANLRICLAGHYGDYDIDGWDVIKWSRPSTTMGSSKTKDAEALWFSPACCKPESVSVQQNLFGGKQIRGLE